MVVSTSSPGIREVSWPDWRYHKFTPKHLALYASTAKLIICNAGRAYGKDHVCLLKVFTLAISLYFERLADPTWFRFGPRVTVCIACPKEENYEALWKRVKTMLPDFGESLGRDGQPVVNVRETDKEITLFGADEIFVKFVSVFKGGDSQRGWGYDILLLSEAAYTTEKTVTEAIENLVLRPDYAGFFFMNSTPQGPGHWWDMAIDGARKGVGYWSDYELHEGDFTDNAKSTEAHYTRYLARRKANLARCRKEVLGWIKTLVSDTSDVMGEGESKAISEGLIAGILINNRVARRGPYRIGIDLSGTGPDPLGVAVLDGNGIICHLEKHQSNTPESIIELIIRLNEFWKPISINFDANGKLGSDVSKSRLRLLPNVHPIKTPTNGKLDQVTHLLNHMGARSIRLPNPEAYEFGDTKYQEINVTLLLRELRDYRRFELARQVMRNQRIRGATFTTFSKPPNGSDDLLDALVYALLDWPVPRIVRDLDELTDEERLGLGIPVRHRPLTELDFG